MEQFQELSKKKMVKCVCKVCNKPVRLYLLDKHLALCVETKELFANIFQINNELKNLTARAHIEKLVRENENKILLKEKIFKSCDKKLPGHVNSQSLSQGGLKKTLTGNLAHLTSKISSGSSNRSDSGDNKPKNSLLPKSFTKPLGGITEKSRFFHLHRQASTESDDPIDSSSEVNLSLQNKLQNIKQKESIHSTPSPKSVDTSSNGKNIVPIKEEVGEDLWSPKTSGQMKIQFPQAQDNADQSKHDPSKTSLKNLPPNQENPEANAGEQEEKPNKIDLNMDESPKSSNSSNSSENESQSNSDSESNDFMKMIEGMVGDLSQHDEVQEDNNTPSNMSKDQTPKISPKEVQVKRTCNYLKEIASPHSQNQSHNNSRNEEDNSHRQKREESKNKNEEMSEEGNEFTNMISGLIGGSYHSDEEDGKGHQNNVSADKNPFEVPDSIEHIPKVNQKDEQGPKMLSLGKPQSNAEASESNRLRGLFKKQESFKKKPGLSSGENSPRYRKKVDEKESKPAETGEGSNFSIKFSIFHKQKNDTSKEEPKSDSKNESQNESIDDSEKFTNFIGNLLASNEGDSSQGNDDSGNKNSIKKESTRENHFQSETRADSDMFSGRENEDNESLDAKGKKKDKKDSDDDDDDGNTFMNFMENMVDKGDSSGTPSKGNTQESLVLADEKKDIEEKSTPKFSVMSMLKSRQEKRNLTLAPGLKKYSTTEWGTGILSKLGTRQGNQEENDPRKQQLDSQIKFNYSVIAFYDCLSKYNEYLKKETGSTINRSKPRKSVLLG